MDKLVSVEHKVEQSLYGVAPATMKFMRKSHRNMKMLSARRMLSELVVNAEVSRGWKNVVRSGDSISNREFRTLVSGTGEDVAIACVLRDVLSYDGKEGMRKFLGSLTRGGIRCSKILEETIVDSVDFQFDLRAELEFAYSIKLYKPGGGTEARRLIMRVLGIAEDIVPSSSATTLDAEGVSWSLKRVIEHLVEYKWKEEKGSGLCIEWKVMNVSHKGIIITIKDNVMTLSKGKEFRNYFQQIESEPFSWDNYLVTKGYTKYPVCFTVKDENTTIEGRNYNGNKCVVVSNMKTNLSSWNLTGKLKCERGDRGVERINDSIAALVGTSGSLKNLVEKIGTARNISSDIITRVMRMTSYLLNATKGYKVLTETITNMRELTGINQDYTYQYNVDVIRYEEIMDVVRGTDTMSEVFSAEDIGRAERVLRILRRQVEPTQELIMKEVMISVASGEIDYMMSTSSSIDRLWLDQFYGTNDNRRIKLSKGKTCVVDALDNYYVSIPSSKVIYIYYKDNGREIRDIGSEHQMFRSKSSPVTSRALVELCCVFKPSITSQGSLTIDPYKMEQNRKKAESGLIYMLGRRCEDIAEDLSRNKVIWDERRIKVSKMRSWLIPEYLKEEYDREWFMREIVASYIKAGLQFSRKSQYQCYAKALGGIESESGGLEFDIPMCLKGVEARKIENVGSEKMKMRSGTIDLIESEHTWAGKVIYDSKAVTKTDRFATTMGEKIEVSGFVGGSEHNFDSAALFRAVRKITFARSDEVDNVIEEGSMEHKSVEYIRNLYAIDKASVREIFSKLGYPSPEIVRKVVNSGKISRKNSDVNIDVDKSRILAAIANKISKMNAEVDGSDPIKIEESGAVAYLEENMEEHGTYVKFLAGLLELGEVGIVDEIMEVFRKERKERIDMEKGKSVVKRDERSEPEDESKCGDIPRRLVESVDGMIHNVFIISEIMESHPYVIARDEEDRVKKRAAGVRGRIHSRIISRTRNGNPTVEESNASGKCKEDREKNTDIKRNKREKEEKSKVSHGAGETNIVIVENEGHKSVGNSMESEDRTSNCKAEKVRKIAVVCVKHGRRRVKIILDSINRSILEKMMIRKGQREKVSTERLRNIIKTLKENGKRKESKVKIQRKHQCQIGCILKNGFRTAHGSCLEEMVKTRRTHFKTKKRQEGHIKVEVIKIL